MHGAKRNYKKVVNSSTNSEVILEYANFLADIDQNPILAEGFYSQVLHLDPSNQEARRYDKAKRYFLYGEKLIPT
jgi:hypothetical protein